MNRKEYIKYVCSKCKYKYNNLDICEIRQTINGNAKCINFMKCGFWERVKRLLKSEKCTSILK